MVKNLLARMIKPIYVSLRDRLGKAIFAPRAHLRTEGVIPLEELNLASPDRMRYKALGWSILPRILPARQVSSDDVFIDYGSGMGRVVYEAAARYPFKRVIGLELSEELNEIARANLDRNSSRLCCSSVEIVTGDALEYDPPADVTVALFYNPFTGAILETAVQKLLNTASGPLRIVYCNPIEHDLLMATGRLVVKKRLRGWRPGKVWSRSNATIMYERVSPVTGMPDCAPGTTQPQQRVQATTAPDDGKSLT
jgi:Histone methylation protein DOT1